MIDGHGDDGWKYAVPLRADFSSNVYYGELDAGLRGHLRGAIDTVTHYPEAGAASVQHAAAEAYGVDPGSVLVTNGAVEAIYLIAQRFRGKRATIVGPTFAEYEDACTIHGIDIQRVSWEQLSAQSTGGMQQVARLPEGVAFICNPNNPTGKAIAMTELLAVVDRWPDTVFVVDESYIDFTPATSTLIAAGRPNVLILRSMTKSCRIPGLRLGFLIGQESVITQVAAHKMPWSVNRLAIDAGLYIFQHRDEFAVPTASLLAATAQWQRELKEATGWKVCDTDTHYFLMETPGIFTAAQLKWHLVSNYGLLIRDAANFNGLGPHHFRVACQSPEQNKFLTEALHECSRTGI